MSVDEFLWAFTTVGARSLVLNNEPYQLTTDPNSVYMLLPLLDFINHDPKPNVVALPYHDKVNN